jgi:hypothetical protein
LDFGHVPTSAGLQSGQRGKAAIDQRNSIIGGGTDFDRLDRSLALLVGLAPKLIGKCLKIVCSRRRCAGKQTQNDNVTGQSRKIGCSGAHFRRPK